MDACTWEMIRRVLLPSWVGALAEENGRLPCGLVAAVREDVKTMSPCPWRGECTVKSGALLETAALILQSTRVTNSSHFGKSFFRKNFLVIPVFWNPTVSYQILAISLGKVAKITPEI